MVKCNVKSFFRVRYLLLVFLFICLFNACSTTNSKPLLIAFSADSSSLVFSNIDRPGLLQLTANSAKDSVLNELISVLQVPSESDTTIKEMPLEGKLILSDSNIVFKPAKPFVKGNEYLVITYLNARFGTAGQILKAQLSTSVRPYQISLKR